MYVLDYVNSVLWLGIPDLTKELVLSIVFLSIFKNTIREHSPTFYIYPGLLFLWYCTYRVLNSFNVSLYEMIGGTVWWMILWLPHSYALNAVIGIAFILIVMFIRVLPGWEFVGQLYTIRKGMSIIGGLILVDHGVVRFPTMKQAWENMKEMNGFLVFSYAILGVVLLVLIFIPQITSFHFARKRLIPKGWRKLQTYISVLLMILIYAFGIAISLGWGFAILPGFGSSLWDIQTVMDSTAVSNLSQGYQMATAFLSAKLYLVLMVVYIQLRRKKVKKQSQPAKQVKIQEETDLINVN